MKVEFKEKSIIFDNRTMQIDDLYDASFYAFSDKEASKYYNDTYGVNEVFNNLIQNYLAIKKWLADFKPKEVEIKDAAKDIMFFSHDLCEFFGVTCNGYKAYKKIFTWLSYQATALAASADILWLQSKIKRKDDIKASAKFAVLRHKGAIKKFKKFSEIDQEIESLYSKDSIYRLFPMRKRMWWVCQAYFKSFRTMKKMKSFYCHLLGNGFKYPLMDFYKERIVYAELYQLMLDEYFSHFEDKGFYTGNNLDRYSVIEDQLCKKHHIKSYNIPHGIEYGFKFPKGFSSDVFYVHSQYTADFLNKLYATDKYVYKKEIIRRMFEYGYDKPHEKMVIFFTEPREVHVNVEIVSDLLPKLKEKGIKLYLKLHPGDNKGNYSNLNVDFITDYELSLTGNICISRKSTILLEAIYNNSLPIAIITNPKDKTTFNMFPSLNAKEIIKTYNTDDLYEVIIKNI